MTNPQTVIGIDVGGDRKGFHAVLLRDGQIFGTKADRDPAAMAAWCFENEACVVAVDAPCRWNADGKSRAAERQMNKQGLHCYYTPARELANGRNFYQWVFNGERLYHVLEQHYPQFNGRRGEGHVCMETFPHAIVCALEGRVVPTHPKNSTRRRVLRNVGYDDACLTCIDFVDAALCAVAADAFSKGHFRAYGDGREGYIVAPENRAPSEKGNVGNI